MIGFNPNRFYYDLQELHPTKMHIRTVTALEIACNAADPSLCSCPRVVVERKRVSAREAVVVCRYLEAYLKNLLPKEHAKNMQAVLPSAAKDDEGNTLKPIGKLSKDDDFLSVPIVKQKKLKKNEKLEFHSSYITGAFAMIKVALPLNKGDVSACLAQVEHARVAFEARAEARIEGEDMEVRPRAAGDEVEARQVKYIECGPIERSAKIASCMPLQPVICSPHRAVTVAAIVKMFLFFVVVRSLLHFLGFGAFFHGAFVHGSELETLAASVMTCIAVWAESNGRSGLQGFTWSFFRVLGIETLV